MWIFTRYGFFSAVCADKGDGKTKRLDKSRVMVRARDRAHLDALKRKFRRMIGKARIVSTPDADYPVRILIKKSVWESVAASLAADVDYGNFKAAVAAATGRDDYEGALHRVWATMRTIEPGESRPLPSPLLWDVPPDDGDDGLGWNTGTYVK